MEHDLNINEITWKSEYNIGDYKIDNEHQKLFAIARKALSINALHNDDKEKVQLKEIISELFTYIKTHFSNEEAFMESIDFPELTNHKIIHKNILNLLTHLVTHLSNLDITEIEKKLSELIEEYFIKHILIEDKKIKIWNTSIEDLRKTFGWKDIYSVDDKTIDNEHKQLFEIAQEAFDLSNTQERNEKVKEVITSLYDYMKVHFNHEEDFMSKIFYPKREEHKKLHEDIIKSMNNFVLKLPSMNIELFEKELARLIDSALVQHIIQEDRKIVQWNKANAAKS